MLVRCRKAGASQVVTLTLDLALEQVGFLKAFLIQEFALTGTGKRMKRDFQACVQAIAETVSRLGGCLSFGSN